MLNGFYTCVNRRGNNILYRGYDEDGMKVYNKFKFRPKLFIESSEPNCDWTSLEGTSLEMVRFDTLSDSRQFTKQYEGLKSFKIYGMQKPVPAFVQAEFPNEIKYKQNQIDVAIIDLECKSEKGFPDPAIADQEITLITVRILGSDKYITWGTKSYDESKSVVPHLKKEYRCFNNEVAMLEDFLEWWTDSLNCPDVITGWNTRFFDMPYIINRVARLLGNDIVNLLSPWGTVESKTTFIKGQEKVFYNIFGIQQLDYLELFKKFTVNTYGAQESYKLDFIAELVLGENKIDYSDDYGTLTELYNKNFNLYLDYNLVDCELIEKMEGKVGLLSLAFTLAYYGGVNYEDTLGTVAIWDSIIFRRLALKKIAIPNHDIGFKQEYAGGFVKDVAKGRHEWVMSFDLNSLYPMLIVQYNMSPETIVKHMKDSSLTPEFMLDNPRDSWNPEDGLTIAANGACFRTDKQGIIPEIIEEIYSDRVSIKREMLDAESERENLLKQLALL